MQWFSDQEKKGKGTWRSDSTYEQIINHNSQLLLDFDDFSECDTGHCGL